MLGENGKIFTPGFNYINIFWISIESRCWKNVLNLKPFFNICKLQQKILHHLSLNNVLDNEHGKYALLKCKISIY